MAKKATIKAGLFSKTTPAATKQAAATDEAFDPTDRRRRPEGSKVKPLSVSLMADEYDEIGVMGDSIGATRMAVMNAAIRHTVALYRAGKVKLKANIKGGRIVANFE